MNRFKVMFQRQQGFKKTALLFLRASVTSGFSCEQKNFVEGRAGTASVRGYERELTGWIPASWAAASETGAGCALAAGSARLARAAVQPDVQLAQRLFVAGFDSCIQRGTLGREEKTTGETIRSKPGVQSKLRSMPEVASENGSQSTLGRQHDAVGRLRNW